MRNNTGSNRFPNDVIVLRQEPSVSHSYNMSHDTEFLISDPSTMPHADCRRDFREEDGSIINGSRLHLNSGETTEAELFPLANLLPHCPVILVLDTSHSMWGKGLCDLNDSIQMFYQTIRREQFPNSKIDIAAVSMGDRLGMLEEFTAFECSVLPSKEIRPKGDTPIGAALELALGKLKEQNARYRQNNRSSVTPELVLLSDGISSDDFSRVASRIRQLSGNGVLRCRAIALGETPDLDALRRIAGENVLLPHHGEMKHAFAEIGRVISECYEAEASTKMIEAVGEILSDTPSSCSADFSAASSRYQDTKGGAEGKGPVYLIDGSNLAYWDRIRSGISLRPVLAVTRYLESAGTPYQVFFDATMPYRLPREEKAEYETLLEKDPDHFLQVPAGSRADDFLLYMADEHPGARILSNDRYTDHVKRYPWIRSSDRLIPGMILNHHIFFPNLSLSIPLKSERRSAESNPANLQERNSI